MRRLLILLILTMTLIQPMLALDYTAPPPPEDVAELVPEKPETFAQGLWFVVRQAVGVLQPSIAQAAKCCVQVVCAVLLTTLVRHMPGRGGLVSNLLCAAAVAGILLEPGRSLIALGAETVHSLSDYGKLLLPVLTAAMAAQGMTGTSAALYLGTAGFDAALGSLMSALLVPGIYMFLALSAVHSALGEELLKTMADFLKWLITWGLKLVLYAFFGYMSITGVVSGTADGAALKVTKIAISGMVPVIGGMLSDASQTLLVSAGVVKGAVGVYGLLVVAAIWIEPFIRIGVQCIMLKLTAAVCMAFAGKEGTGLIDAFSQAMGFLLAITGTECLLLVVSTVVFMKGAAW